MENQKPRRRRLQYNQLIAREYPIEQIHHAIPVLEALDKAGFLTPWQLARLFFLGEKTSEGVRSAASAQKRVSDKCLNRLIDRRWVRGLTIRPFGIDTPLNGIEVVHLTLQGRRQLAFQRGNPDAIERGWPPKHVAPQTLGHHYMVSEVICQILSAARINGWEISGWLHDRQLKSINGEGGLNMGLVPDGIIFLGVGERTVPLILEMDMGSEPIDSMDKNSWRSKLTQYAEFFQHRYPEHPIFQGCVHPLVLIIAPTQKRIANLRAFASSRCQAAYWWASFDQFSINPFGEIWQFAHRDGVESLEVALAGERIDRRIPTRIAPSVTQYVVERDE